MKLFDVGPGVLYVIAKSKAEACQLAEKQYGRNMGYEKKDFAKAEEVDMNEARVLEPTACMEDHL